MVGIIEENKYVFVSPGPQKDKDKAAYFSLMILSKLLNSLDSCDMPEELKDLTEDKLWTGFYIVKNPDNKYKLYYYNSESWKFIDEVEPALLKLLRS